MADLSAKDLAAMDKAATVGEWETLGRGNLLWIDNINTGHGYEGEMRAEDAAFIVALVNAYRAGKLVHVDRLRALEAEWIQHANSLSVTRSTWLGHSRATLRKCAGAVSAIIGEKGDD